MIDDDFQNIFRKMIEQFFGSSAMPNGNEGFELRVNQMQQKDQAPRVDESGIEKIEFDDSILLLVDRVEDIVAPIVRVKGMNVAIEIWRGKSITLVDDIPFNADPENSFVSLKNGVLEVTLKRGAMPSTEEWYVPML